MYIQYIHLTLQLVPVTCTIISKNMLIIGIYYNTIYVHITTNRSVKTFIYRMMRTRNKNLIPNVS